MVSTPPGVGTVGVSVRVAWNPTLATGFTFTYYTGCRRREMWCASPSARRSTLDNSPQLCRSRGLDRTGASLPGDQFRTRHSRRIRPDPARRCTHHLCVDNRGDPALGWSLTTYMVPTPQTRIRRVLTPPTYATRVRPAALDADGQFPPRISPSVRPSAVWLPATPMPPPTPAPAALTRRVRGPGAVYGVGRAQRWRLQHGHDLHPRRTRHRLCRNLRRHRRVSRSRNSWPTTHRARSDHSSSALLDPTRSHQTSRLCSPRRGAPEGTGVG